jgi:branched-chain amino acid aminotransferase
MLVYVNGRIVPKEEATVSVFDHGFLYGDGVFEGIRAYDGVVFRLEQHIDRLFESAQTISLQIPLSREEMMDATVQTIAANNKRDAYIRVVVSRGAGDLGIDPGNCRAATVVIIVDAIKLYPEEMYQKGIPLITASVRRTPLDCLDSRVKSLNYLNNIMAKLQAKQVGALEAVMLNMQGTVAECTADNLFIVKRGVVKTPDPTQGALGGITRGAILELARREGLETVETVIALHDVYNADECFLTGTGAEVVPVIALDGRRIHDGKPGPITTKLMAEFRKLRSEDGVRVVYEVTPREVPKQPQAGRRSPFPRRTAAP